MPEIELADAEKIRQSKKLKRQIRALYKETAEEFNKKIRHLSKDQNTSAILKKMMLSQHIKYLEREMDRIDTEIAGQIKSSMNKTAQSVIDANIKFMGKLGLSMAGAFSSVPNKVISNLLSGKVYKGDWSFSKAIWKQSQKAKDDIYRIVAKGVAANKSTYDIAKDLEKYVNPAARKPWDWSKIYPGTNKKIDYNAQRLARTLTQHAYQQAYRETIKHNPFITGVIWHSVFSERSCEICMDRDGQRFDKGTEPLDHPQGMCYLEPEIPKSLDEIGNEIADWVHGGENAGLDEYMKYAYED